MIPPQLLAAIAPVAVEHIAKALASPPQTTTGAATLHPDEAVVGRPAAAPAQSPTADMLAGVAVDWWAHEKRKSSVRPAMMLATGRLSLGSAIMAALASTFPAWATAAFGMDIEVAREAADYMVNTLLLIAAGGGTAYGYKHTVRSVDKAKGTA